MTDPRDWAATLLAQGVPRSEIAEAQATARRLAAAADAHPHDPKGGADPAGRHASLRAPSE